MVNSKGIFSCTDNRVRISGLHFTKCKSILNFCKALSQGNNKNGKLSILLLAPKFHLVTVIFWQNKVLQKHLISWHNLILQPPHQANFHTVYMTSFRFCFYFFIFLSHSVVQSNNCQMLFKCQITFSKVLLINVI